MKRKWIAVLLMLALCTASAMAEPYNADADAMEKWAKGTARTVHTMDLFAPAGGRLEDFDVKVGDVVNAGDALFSVNPLKVHSPESGTVRLAKAAIGDQASSVISQYGALLYIDREDVMRVRATTAAAYNKPKNRAIVLGETLRVYNGVSSDPLDAIGIVVSVDGKGYVVEIPADVFELEDKVRLYRGDGDTYNAKDKVGEGRVERAQIVPVLGDGVVMDVRVKEGLHVTKGDVLYMLDEASAVYTQAPSLYAVPDMGGAVTAIYVQDGQQVRKEQLLMTYKPLNEMEFVVDVDEMDIPSVQLGQTMQVRVDALGDNRIAAAVKSISPLGITVLDTTKYQVTLSIQGTVEGLLPGMHVTAYWE